MSNSRYSRAALLASTTLSLALISAAVSAQEATQSAEIESPATMLDEIIVSAGKEKVAIDTPQAVSSVSQEQIEASQSNTLGEILNTVPGVTTINADNALGPVFEHSWYRWCIRL